MEIKRSAHGFEDVLECFLRGVEVQILDEELVFLETDAVLKITSHHQ